MTRTVAGWSSLGAAERLARLRCLSGLVRVFAGPDGRAALDAIAEAEQDIAALSACDDALAALPSLTARRILATLSETLPAPRATP